LACGWPDPPANCRTRSAVKLGRKPEVTEHQKHEAIKRRDTGNETLADIGRSYNVSPATISPLTA
jgi:hypothetical protein